MICDLKPYPEFIESGLPWLGQVPAHWDVLPNRAIFEEIRDKGHDNEELLSVTITKGIMRQNFLLSNSSKKDSSRQDKSAYKLVKPGEIAYNKMRAWQGAFGVSDYRGIISPAYIVMKLRSGSNTSRYFHHLFRTVGFAKEAERWSYGITSDMWSLRPEHFKMIYIPLPPPAEQAAIVRFLDWAKGRLDRAIRAKRKIISLLNEQKQAIIHLAVTRGLDPDVPLKDSGVPWLGEIPAHWEISPLKQALVRMDYGTSESSTADGKYRVLTMGHIQDGKVLVPESGGIDNISVELTLRTNDLLFNRTNSPELVGKVGIYEGKNEPQVTFASYLVRLRVKPAHNPQWLSYLLNSFQFWAYARSQALVSLHQANLNSNRYGRMTIPVPPRVDQDSIVANINDRTDSIKTTISRFEREIELLREYRTRLVADVVTGKLDVRLAAAKIRDDEILDSATMADADVDESETVSGEDDA